VGKRERNMMGRRSIPTAQTGPAQPSRLHSSAAGPGRGRSHIARMAHALLGHSLSCDIRCNNHCSRSVGLLIPRVLDGARRPGSAAGLLCSFMVRVLARSPFFAFLLSCLSGPYRISALPIASTVLSPVCATTSLSSVENELFVLIRPLAGTGRSQCGNIPGARSEEARVRRL